MLKVRKVVILVVGLGIWFLFVIKVMFKEMLLIVDKLMIQFIVDEVCKLGIEDIVIVMGKSKCSIEDYYDFNLELEDNLWVKYKEEMFKLV